MKSTTLTAPRAKAPEPRPIAAKSRPRLASEKRIPSPSPPAGRGSVFQPTALRPRCRNTCLKARTCSAPCTAGLSMKIGINVPAAESTTVNRAVASAPNFLTMTGARNPPAPKHNVGSISMNVAAAVPIPNASRTSPSSGDKPVTACRRPMPSSTSPIKMAARPSRSPGRRLASSLVILSGEPGRGLDHVRLFLAGGLRVPVNGEHLAGNGASVRTRQEDGQRGDIGAGSMNFLTD